MKLLEEQLSEVDHEIKSRLSGDKTDLKTPLHPRIEQFYYKWKDFYKNNISIKSLPDENDRRYK